MNQDPRRPENLDARAVVLVEGTSDVRAVKALALRRGRDLPAEGVAVVPIGGAHAIVRFVTRLGPPGLRLRLAGLCDAAEERHFRRALERAGFGADLLRADLERLGFGVCVPDLEGELVRALGVARVEMVLAAEGDLEAFRTLQRQPAWRERPANEQLRRFLGCGAGRKTRYASRLVEALDLDLVPRPLDLVLAHVGVTSGAP